MPPRNRRPSSPYSTPVGGSSRPSAPYYDRRANSPRRDVRMDKRQRSSGPNPALLILIVAAVIFVGIVIGTSGSSPDPAPLPTQPALQSPTQQTAPPAETTQPKPSETVKEPLIYDDSRVPNYVATNPKWERQRYEWELQDDQGSMWLEVDLDVNMYQYYTRLERYFGVANYVNYANDPQNQAIIASIVEVIRDTTVNDLSYSPAAVAREVAKFVQDVIEYQYDSDTTGEDEYPRYPIETLYERQGDCEDTSILMAAMLKELGYEVGFLHVPGHLAVALRTSDDYTGGAYYEFNGHRYLFIESTGSGWNIGDIPEDYWDVPATLYLIP